jgi:hypothetical protein
MSIAVKERILPPIAHFTSGLISSLAVIVSPVLSVLGVILFILYEFDEEWKLSDYAYQEIMEFATGFYLGCVALIYVSIK